MQEIMYIDSRRGHAPLVVVCVHGLWQQLKKKKKKKSDKSIYTKNYGFV